MSSDKKDPIWESYGLFALVDGKPLTWIEFSGDQQKLLDRMGSEEGVFGVEIRIPKPRAEAMSP